MAINHRNKELKRMLISDQEVERIQAGLLERNYEPFNRIVRSPLETQLPLWLETLYPSLLDDVEDLSHGVYRRLKNELKKIKSPHSFDLFVQARKYLVKECESTLPTPINIKNNLGLTKTDFKKLLAKLSRGDDALIEKVYLAHFEKCVAIVVKQTNCSEELAHESTLDALLEISKDLEQGKIRYGNLQSYFTKRAINKYFKRERKKKITPLQSAGLDFYDTEEDKDFLVELEFNAMVYASIRKLGKECQYILRQFYFEELKMMEIGKEMNKSHEAVRKQATRCRNKLKGFIGEKFYKEFINHFSK